MGTDAANLRSLRDVLRALVICIIGCALVAGIAIAMAEESGVRRSDSASAVACDGAAKLGTATESKATANAKGLVDNLKSMLSKPKEAKAA